MRVRSQRLSNDRSFPNIYVCIRGGLWDGGEALKPVNMHPYGLSASQHSQVS